MSAVAVAPIEREFTVRSRSQTQQALRRFLRNRPATGALVFFLVVLVAAFVVPRFFPYDFRRLDDAAPSAPPGTGGHLLGTDTIGRDVLLLVLRGIQRSIFMAGIFVLVAGTVGIAIGAVAGYFGRYVDSVLMRFVDVLLTIPEIAVIVVIAAAIPGARSPVGIALLISVLGWTALSRIVRGQFLTLREREYVEAAQALGARDRRIIARHLLPNSIGQIIVWATLGAAGAVISEAALSYLGFGVQGADTSLGRLVADGAAAADSRPWLFYFPGLALLLLVLAVNLIGDGIRDAFDPSGTRIRA